MTQFGVRSTLVPRNDVSTNRGQFDLQTALRYISEAYGGYHLDVLHGINFDAGIFMSYVGLFSYDNFENWMYLPSFTSDNTPWFFNGVRLQMFHERQAQDRALAHQRLAVVRQVQRDAGLRVRRSCGGPTEWFASSSNDYVGWDTQNNPGRLRFHSDNSVQVRYFNDPNRRSSTRAAFSVTADIGGEHGDGVTPFGGKRHRGTTARPRHPCAQQFLSWMAYNRLWFFGDHLALDRRRRHDAQPRALSRARADRQRVALPAAAQRPGGVAAATT